MKNRRLFFYVLRHCHRGMAIDLHYASGKCEAVVRASSTMNIARLIALYEPTTYDPHVAWLWDVGLEAGDVEKI